MSSVGLRELKQNPSAVVARAEHGETIVITVQGRPVAQIMPLAPVRQRWVPAAELDRIFAEIGPDTTGWAAEYATRPEGPIIDPWERAGL